MTRRDRRACEAISSVIRSRSSSNYRKEALDPPSSGWLGRHCDRGAGSQFRALERKPCGRSYNSAFLTEHWRPVDRDAVLCRDRRHPMRSAEAQKSGQPADAGRPACFLVADPASAPANDTCVYARPDDLSDHVGSCSDVLIVITKPDATIRFRFFLRPSFTGTRYTASSQSSSVSTRPTFCLRDGVDPGIIFDALLRHYLCSERGRLEAEEEARCSFEDLLDAFRSTRAKNPVSRRKGLSAALHAADSILKDDAHRFLQFGNIARIDDRPVRPLSYNNSDNWHYECAAALLRGALTP